MDADLIAAQLDRLGPGVQAVRAADRAEYAAALQADGFDVILSDYSLPGFDGMSALEMARQAVPDTPFIFVSGVLGEEIAADALKQGATDYVMKSRLNRLQPAVNRALAEAEARQAAKATEETLREREASYRALVEAIGTVVWTTSPDGQVDDLPEWRRLTGQTYEEQKGWGWLDAIHPDDREPTAAAWARAVETRSVYDVEYRIRRRDGGYCWYNSRGVPVIDGGLVRKWVGVCIDIHSRKQADEQLRLMVHELNHRVKNNLASVQAIAAQTLRESKGFAEAKADFTARLSALARAHDVLTSENWEGATLAELFAAVLEPHCSAAAPERCSLAGPGLWVNSKVALALSMAMHELGTNAAKYGAFSVAEGVVSVHWELEEAEGGSPRLRIEWRETGGPPVQAPSRRGFGSRLIERGLAAELRGDVRLEFDPAGVVCRIDVPFDGRREPA